MTARFLHCSLFFLASALPASADFITGQVVDEFGVGVPGVDIDVKNLGGGGDPPISNDGTDAFGNFTTTVPAGFYRVTFTPPPPPTTTHLILEVEDVIVVGTTNMGVISLPPGVAVSGRVRDQGGLPVPGVNIDVVELSTGENLDLVGDQTDAFGDFAVAAPAVPIELRLKTAGVVGSTLAPRAMKLNLTASSDLGDVVLEPGFIVSGTVLGPGLVPLANIDFDFHRVRTGGEIYTPGDNTDGTGAFSIVVPAGRYQAAVCPTQGQKLVGRLLPEFAVTADLSLGTVELESGVAVSGIVRSFDGTPIAGADVDAKRSDGSPIHLCTDNSNATGAYSVIVPTGLISFEFEPPGYSLPLGIQDVTSVNVTADMALDASLPSCPFGTPVGSGSAGAGGLVPDLSPTGGAPRVGNSGYGYSLTNALGGAIAFLSTSSIGPAGPRSGAMPGFKAPLGDSTPVFLHGTTLLSGTPGVAGAGSASYSVPVDASLLGLSIVTRAYVLDVDAAGSLARSAGLLVTFCE